MSTFQVRAADADRGQGGKVRVEQGDRYLWFLDPSEAENLAAVLHSAASVARMREAQYEWRYNYKNSSSVWNGRYKTRLAAFDAAAENAHADPDFWEKTSPIASIEVRVKP